MSRKPEGTVVFVCRSVPSVQNTTRYRRASLLCDTYDTHILARGDICPTITENATDTKVVDETFLWRLLFPLYIVWYVFRVSRRSEFDHVHTTHAPQSLFAGALLQLGGFVWVADIWDDPRLGNDLDRRRSVPRLAARAYNDLLIRVAHRTLHRADLVVLALHPGVLSDYAISPHAENVLHVTNGVDPALIPERLDGSGPLRVVYVGPVRRERGISELLEAIQHLSPDTPEIEVELIGRPDPSTVAEIETRAASGEFQPHSVRVVGRLPHEEVLRRVSSADIGVCLLSPSVRNYHYAYPIKLFEYLAGGTAVICTRMYGTSELLTDGVDGVLVPANDSDAVKQSIGRLAQDDSFRRSLSERGRRTTTAYDWERIDGRIQDELSNL